MVSIRIKCAGAVVLGVLWVCVPRAFAYTFEQVGVNSNILVLGGEVALVQADGSLTVLELATGRVLKRLTDRDYSTRLAKTPHGVLSLRYDRVATLRPGTWEVGWATEGDYRGWTVAGDDLFGYTFQTYEDDRTVECRDMGTGKVRWRYPLSQVNRMVPMGSGVLLMTASAERWNWRREEVYVPRPTIAVLDRESGQEIYRKEAPDGVHYFDVHFDGVHAFVGVGQVKGSRSNAVVERMESWAADG